MVCRALEEFATFHHTLDFGALVRYHLQPSLDPTLTNIEFTRTVCNIFPVLLLLLCGAISYQDISYKSLKLQLRRSTFRRNWNLEPLLLLLLLLLR